MTDSPESKPVSFAEILEKASCNRELRRLADLRDKTAPMHDDHTDYLREEAGIAESIEVVLGIIARTPNAFVNREALDALQNHVEVADSLLKTYREDWGDLEEPDSDEGSF